MHTKNRSACQLTKRLNNKYEHTLASV